MRAAAKVTVSSNSELKQVAMAKTNAEEHTDHRIQSEGGSVDSRQDPPVHLRPRMCAPRARAFDQRHHFRQRTAGRLLGDPTLVSQRHLAGRRPQGDIETDVGRLTVADATHISGAQRAQNLKWCLTESGFRRKRCRKASGDFPQYLLYPKGQKLGPYAGSTSVAAGMACVGYDDKGKVQRGKKACKGNSSSRRFRPFQLAAWLAMLAVTIIDGGACVFGEVPLEWESPASSRLSVGMWGVGAGLPDRRAPNVSSHRRQRTRSSFSCLVGSATAAVALFEHWQANVSAASTATLHRPSSPTWRPMGASTCRTSGDESTGFARASSPPRWDEKAPVLRGAESEHAARCPRHFSPKTTPCTPCIGRLRAIHRRRRIFCAHSPESDRARIRQIGKFAPRHRAILRHPWRSDKQSRSYVRANRRAIGLRGRKKIRRPAVEANVMQITVAAERKFLEPEFFEA